MLLPSLNAPTAQGGNSRRHKAINFSEPADKAHHDKMVSLLEQMLDQHKRKATADAASQERLGRLIDSTDKQIDALVYELYELTQEEIAVVEGK